MCIPSGFSEGFDYLAFIHHHEGLEATVLIREVGFSFNAPFVELFANHQEILSVPKPDVTVATPTNIPTASNQILKGYLGEFRHDWRPSSGTQYVN
jgi:hypothetical protein